MHRFFTIRHVTARISSIYPKNRPFSHSSYKNSPTRLIRAFQPVPFLTLDYTPKTLFHGPLSPRVHIPTLFSCPPALFSPRSPRLRLVLSPLFAPSTSLLSRLLPPPRACFVFPYTCSIALLQVLLLPAPLALSYRLVVSPPRPRADELKSGARVGVLTNL